MSAPGNLLAAGLVDLPLRTRSRTALLLELSKARLSGMVVLTAGVGFWLASAGAGTDWLTLVLMLIGTTLSACGANALNQCVEVRRDARMLRTCHRPLPSGELLSAPAWTAALLMALTGPLVLLAGTNMLTAALSAGCIALYVLVYTPLKVLTPYNTLVGAVVGAIPPLMGWTAATGTIGIGGLALAGVLFVWQIPHFLALAWMYRDDYARGGYRMLPLDDPDGGLTCRVMLLYCLMLVPVSLMLTLCGAAGTVYAAAALVLGGGLLALGLRLYRARTRENARRLFLGSVIYLPLLLGAMSLDRGAPGALTRAESARSTPATLLAAGGAHP